MRSNLALLSVLAVMFVVVTCHHHHHHQYFEGYYYVYTNLPHHCYKRIFSEDPSNTFYALQNDNNDSNENTDVNSNENINGYGIAPTNINNEAVDANSSAALTF
ncbi:uncharacterized protein LOC122503475 [Leptopilina heterotoma]|uniref:uncharacterized protein LOC122503475 n=1 Tax=Leptopilina heterotoma TaxID=63436 RepID=UPI001CA9C513|nr:uncharacterized protein LOC122503475 [Leptopilina heterotoma]